MMKYILCLLSSSNMRGSRNVSWEKVKIDSKLFIVRDRRERCLWWWQISSIFSPLAGFNQERSSDRRQWYIWNRCLINCTHKWKLFGLTLIVPIVCSVWNVFHLVNFDHSGIFGRQTIESRAQNRKKVEDNSRVSSTQLVCFCVNILS